MFPLEYCSSHTWERRCIPCLPSVCESKDVPLACKFNCSAVIRTLNNSSDIALGYCSGWDYLSSPVLIISFVLLLAVIVLLIAACIPLKVRQETKTKQCGDEAGSPLMMVNFDSKVSTDKTDSSSNNYYEKKLKGTPVTGSPQDNKDEYKPTTHSEKK